MTAVFLFIIGLCVGSFLNVLADRLPEDQDVIRGRSHCDHCRRTLSWYELIPVVSFVIQGGKSMCCRRPLSVQYPLVEIGTGLMYVGVGAWFFGQNMPGGIFGLVSALLTISALIVIFVTDLKIERIPTVMLIAAAGGTAAFLLSSLRLQDILIAHVIPAVSTGLFFYALWYFSKGRAMGDGDISLSAVLALFTGFPGTIVGLYAAFLTGAFVGVILMVSRKKSLKSHIAFGPFLIAGFIFAIVYSTDVLKLWRVL